MQLDSVGAPSSGNNSSISSQAALHSSERSSGCVTPGAQDHTEGQEGGRPISSSFFVSRNCPFLFVARNDLGGCLLLLLLLGSDNLF